mgnify:CR=1 FL=1
MDIEKELEKARLKAGLTELERNAPEFEEILKRALQGKARGMKIEYDVFIEQGFTNVQAFEILKLNIQMQPARDIQTELTAFFKGLLSKGGIG